MQMHHSTPLNMHEAMTTIEHKKSQGFDILVPCRRGKHGMLTDGHDMCLIHGVLATAPTVELANLAETEKCLGRMWLVRSSYN